MAQTIEDVLARRTRALFLNARAAIDSADTVARIIASETSREGYDGESDVKDFIQVASAYFRET